MHGADVHEQPGEDQIQHGGNTVAQVLKGWDSLHEEFWILQAPGPGIITVIVIIGEGEDDVCDAEKAAESSQRRAEKTPRRHGQDPSGSIFGNDRDVGLLLIFYVVEIANVRKGSQLFRGDEAGGEGHGFLIQRLRGMDGAGADDAQRKAEGLKSRACRRGDLQGGIEWEADSAEKKDGAGSQRRQALPRHKKAQGQQQREDKEHGVVPDERSERQND